jgi:hypothetical protein
MTGTGRSPKTRMKRFKITILVPHSREILATDLQEAHKEAVRLVHDDDTHPGTPKAVLHSVKFIQDEPEPIDFGFGDEAA